MYIDQLIQIQIPFERRERERVNIQKTKPTKPTKNSKGPESYNSRHKTGKSSFSKKKRGGKKKTMSESSSTAGHTADDLWWDGLSGVANNNNNNPEEGEGGSNNALTTIENSTSTSTSSSINFVSVRVWEINENSTHYEKLIAAPSDIEMKYMWIFWSLIMALVAVVTGYILLAILLSKKARKNPFNGYLMGLMVPDFLMSFMCCITCWINASTGHFYSIEACYFQSFYFIFGIGANSWLNCVIAGRLYKLLYDSQHFRKYEPPTYKQVGLHTICVYIWAAFVASWGIIDVDWLPHHTRLVLGTACIPMDYSTSSTIFFYVCFFPCLMGIPLVYVIYVLYQIKKQNLMPTVGKRRILTVYFLRLAIVFVVMWLPALLFLFILGAWIPHWLVWAGGAWSHLQGLVSSILSLGKPDIKSATYHLWKCQCHPRDTDEDMGPWGGTGGTGGPNNNNGDGGNANVVHTGPQEVRLSATTVVQEPVDTNRSFVGRFIHIFTTPRRSSAASSRSNGGGGFDRSQRRRSAHNPLQRRQDYGSSSGVGSWNNSGGDGGGGDSTRNITKSEHKRIQEDKFQKAMDAYFLKKAAAKEEEVEQQQEAEGRYGVIGRFGDVTRSSGGGGGGGDGRGGSASNSFLFSQPQQRSGGLRRNLEMVTLSQNGGGGPTASGRSSHNSGTSSCNLDMIRESSIEDKEESSNDMFNDYEMNIIQDDAEDTVCDGGASGSGSSRRSPHGATVDMVGAIQELPSSSSLPVESSSLPSSRHTRPINDEDKLRPTNTASNTTHSLSTMGDEESSSASASLSSQQRRMLAYHQDADPNDIV